MTNPPDSELMRESVAEPLRLSQWTAAGADDEPAALEAISGLPGLIQIKTAGPLVSYPRGRSAMLWYGAGDDMFSIVLAGLKHAYAWPELHWRFLQIAQHQALLGSHLERFEGRFGALPVAMTTPLPL